MAVGCFHSMGIDLLMCPELTFTKKDSNLQIVIIMEQSQLFKSSSLFTTLLFSKKKTTNKF